MYSKEQAYGVVPSKRAVLPSTNPTKKGRFHRLARILESKHENEEVEIQQVSFNLKSLTQIARKPMWYEIQLESCLKENAALRACINRDNAAAKRDRHVLEETKLLVKTQRAKERTVGAIVHQNLNSLAQQRRDLEQEVDQLKLAAMEVAKELEATKRVNESLLEENSHLKAAKEASQRELDSLKSLYTSDVKWRYFDNSLSHPEKERYQEIQKCNKELVERLSSMEKEVQEEAKKLAKLRYFTKRLLRKISIAPRQRKDWKFVLKQSKDSLERLSQTIGSETTHPNPRPASALGHRLSHTSLGSDTASCKSR